MKHCGRCKELKPISEFNKNRTRYDGHQSYCRACERDINHMRRYGLTPDEANAILSRGCEVCGSQVALRIDHNHQTGKVRGCLCNGCNVALGLLSEDSDRMLKLALYNNKHKN